MKQAFCYNCGSGIEAKPKSDSLEQQQAVRSLCIQNMLFIEVLKLRWALDTGNRTGRPTLDQLDKYSRDAFLHEHPETGEKHLFEFWCPTTKQQYDIGDMGRCPRCIVFEHQLRED